MQASPARLGTVGGGGRESGGVVGVRADPSNAAVADRRRARHLFRPDRLDDDQQASATYEPRDGVAIGLILVATLPYYARRLAPLPVFVVSVAAVAALFALGYAGGALPMVIAV